MSDDRLSMSNKRPARARVKRQEVCRQSSYIKTKCVEFHRYKLGQDFASVSPDPLAPGFRYSALVGPPNSNDIDVSVIGRHVDLEALVEQHVE
ncbi:hypothetical protein AB7M69_002350 [Bradyrhizobium japonicum]